MTLTGNINYKDWQFSYIPYQKNLTLRTFTKSCNIKQGSHSPNYTPCSKTKLFYKIIIQCSCIFVCMYINMYMLKFKILPKLKTLSVKIRQIISATKFTHKFATKQ